MPWEIDPTGEYDLLYDRIDQGMGCLYFVCDQPLEELSDRDYFHNSLMYHEPFCSWFIRFLSASGDFLNSKELWKDEYYQNAVKNPDFHLDDGTYEDHKNWKSFNDFFARKLKDPSLRPIEAPEDEMSSLLRLILLPRVSGRLMETIMLLLKSLKNSQALQSKQVL